MFKRIAVCVALVVGIVGAATLHAQQTPPPVKRNILQRADVPGTNLEVIYATVEIAANFKAGRHTHPGVVMAQVTDGEFWYAPDGQPEKVYHTGEALTVPSGTIHNEGGMDKGAKLAVIYVLEKGKPIASPAQ